MAEREHTPTPWTHGAFGEIWIGTVQRDGKWDEETPGSAKIVASTSSIDGMPKDANAAFIVRACNAHDDLVEALRDAEYALSNLIETWEFDEDDSAEAACGVEELCGEAACNECGCLKDKRDAARAALAKASPVEGA